MLDKLRPQVLTAMLGLVTISVLGIVLEQMEVAAGAVGGVIALASKIIEKD